MSLTKVTYSMIQGAVFNVLDYGADPTGVSDSTAAINAALAAAKTNSTMGATVYLPTGEYLTQGGHLVDVTGLRVIGAGIDSTRVTIDPATTATGIFILGNKATISVRRHISLKDMTLQMAVSSKYGFEMYGCRDGSEVANVYIHNFTGSAVRLNMAGDGTGAAAGKMNQGVKLTQVICESQQDITAPDGVFNIDGTYETTLDTCAMKGATAATNSGIAVSIGSDGDSRNVVILNMAIPHLGNTTGNIGIKYGEWARECRDICTTYENINGSAVVFDGGNASGQLLPFSCYSVMPRLFVISTASIIDPAVKFGDAASCGVLHFPSYVSTKAWVEFGAFVTGQTRNFVEVAAGNVAPSSLVSGGNVVFDASTPATNVVYGLSTADTNLRLFRVNRTGVDISYEVNGTEHTLSSTHDSTNLASTEGRRWRDSSSNELARVSTRALASGQTALLVRYDNGATEQVERITVGGPDSGGTGFRVLVVPN
jgi:hypothetical protein